MYTEKQLGIIDTGAANTAITIKALFGDVDDVQYQVIINAAITAGAFTRYFSSVSGNSDVKGILCKIPEIQIDDFCIKDFHFYLIDNRYTSRVLLGYDFISSCDIAQIKDSSITFYNFDNESMRGKMLSNKCLDLLLLE